MRAVNPRLVYCAITGYGQHGPLRDRAGHDMNFLGLSGLLGLTGRAGGPPVQAAGQIADLGGGALMAAFGILAALREAERSGTGQVVDVAMADGALSWLAMVAAAFLADGRAPRRGELELAGGLACYRPYACADGGWVTLGRWSRSSGRRGVAASAARTSSTRSSRAGQRRPPRDRGDIRGPHAGGVGGVRRRARVLPRAGARARRGAGLRARRAREMVVGLDQPGVAEPVRLIGAPVRLSRTPADCDRLPGPQLGEHTEAVLRAAGYDAARDRGAARSRRRRAARPPPTSPRRRLTRRVSRRAERAARARA